MVKDGPSNDELMLFAEESNAVLPPDTIKKIKLLIVDDEKEIHTMTRLVLADYLFCGSPLLFLSAYSGMQAKDIIKKNPDIACILLDVVMETQESGLEVARFIRDDIKNDKMRIILRTGQPGKAPEKEIIIHYDINDYKEKTELTNQKLFTTITTALRSYNHLVELEQKNELIIQKNERLNKEIARRIIAESNLTRHNRSLEKMIETKSNRLKTAIQALKQTEKRLKKIQALADIGEMSSLKIDGIQKSNSRLKTNMDIIDQYRSDMSRLLEKYEALSSIITSHPSMKSEQEKMARQTLSDINELKLDMDIDEILRRYPDIIDDSTRGIETISSALTDIKLFIAISEEIKTKNDINEILKSVISDIQKQFPDTIDVQMSLSSIPLAKISRLNMEKALYEIIKNAFQAVEPKGIVSISTSNDATHIFIHISDLGKGIPDSIMKDIFKPYFSANRKQSQGLGLCFAKNVISNDNGSLSIECTKGEGTNVTIKLNALK